MDIASAHSTGTSSLQAIYAVTYTDGTVSCVPLDAKNADYVRLQAWISAGGTLS